MPRLARLAVTTSRTWREWTEVNDLDQFGDDRARGSVPQVMINESFHHQRAVSPWMLGDEQIRSDKRRRATERMHAK